MTASMDAGSVSASASAPDVAGISDEAEVVSDEEIVVPEWLMNNSRSWPVNIEDHSHDGRTPAHPAIVKPIVKHLLPV